MTKRVIPTLLLKNGEFYKSRQFGDYVYLGDACNIIRIFREKDVDEFLILNIANEKIGEQTLKDLQKIVEESFCPITFGGGIEDLGLARRVLHAGVERICFNSASFDYRLLQRAKSEFGASTLSVCVDYSVENGEYCLKKQHMSHDRSFWDHVIHLNKLGLGDIVFQRMDLDGTRKGADFEVTRKLMAIDFKTPILLAGGVNGLEDLMQLKDNFANGLCVGSYFSLIGKYRAPLITYKNPYSQGVR